MPKARVELSAVLSRLTVPMGILAALQPGDRLEAEPPIGADPIVRLVVDGRTVAVAAVSERDGRLLATIMRLGTEPGGRNGDQWQLKKKAAETEWRAPRSSS